MKKQILELLESGEGPVSGETISRKLSVSRVSVWKHIQRLRELGYPIEAGPKGYRLEGMPDCLYPWEVPNWESRIHYFQQLESTMNTAREMARQGADEMTTVVAEVQTRGRGRLERQWDSETGGLYFTVVLRPEVPPMLSYRINFSAAVEMARTLRHLHGVDARLKWPNDILVGEDKIAGMLAEMETKGDRVKYINLGIGLNVNNRPGPHLPKAVSVSEILGSSVPRKAILSDFLDRLHGAIREIGQRDVIAEWKTLAATLGRRVTIATTREAFEGVAEDVDEAGALVLRSDDGSVKRVVWGDCFHGTADAVNPDDA